LIDEVPPQVGKDQNGFHGRNLEAGGKKRALRTRLRWSQRESSLSVVSCLVTAG
jgi:hypothetical protein